jgi:flavin-dependent dehydrogenase
MSKRYDLIIVGAGPGGAMAAKTAGENGLRTALLERKKDPASITRGCAMMFAIESSYYFAERMYYNRKNRKMIFPVNGFSVEYDGPARNFYAWHFYAPDGKTRLAFGNYEEAITRGDQGRLSFVYDKGKLIEGLVDEAVESGVDLFTGLNVDGIEKGEDSLVVTGGGERFEGTFVIAADGINSRIADLVGFNKERTYYCPAPGITYYLTGLTVPQSESIILGNCFQPGAPVPILFWVIPSPYGEDEYWFNVSKKEDFEYVTKKSRFAPWFTGAKVNRAISYVGNLRSPVSEPYRDNVLLVGDSAWFGEAEITGSMMCGWKAAHAITVALKDNKLDREGVLDYISWWNKSYPEFDDYRNFLMIVPFGVLFSEEELTYLFGLFEKPLPPNHNPFLVVRLIKKALLPMMPRIEKEMPSVVEKLQMLEIDKVDELVGNVKTFFES